MWDYRVVVRVIDGIQRYAVHEAFYGDDGETVESITDTPSNPEGVLMQELMIDTVLYVGALSRPPLKYEDFETRKAER